MRIFYLGNNWIGWQILEWLQEQDEEIVGLAVHPPSKRKYGDSIIAAADLESDYIFDGSKLHQAKVVDAIRSLRPDIGLSILFGYIMKPEFLSVFSEGVVNLHPALLPFNRGSYPNVWSIIDGTPAGVTIHHVNEGIDTGDIIAQREVIVSPIDTGETLYSRLEEASIELFCEVWPKIRSGNVDPIPQDVQAGTYYRKDDVDQIDIIQLDETYLARTLINTLRARTFPPYPGAYILINGRRIYLRLTLIEEADLEKE